MPEDADPIGPQLAPASAMCPGGQPPAISDLPAAARAVILALILLGDFIGNTFDSKAGIPAFDRTGEACWTAPELRGGELTSKTAAESDELAAGTVAAALAAGERTARDQGVAHEGADGLWLTREAVQAAFEAAVDEVTCIVGEDRVLDIIPGLFAGEMNVLPVSREQAVTMFNNAADACRGDYNPDGGETTETIRSDSVGDLVVNLAIGLLGNPDRDPDAIIAESWADLADVDLDAFQVWNQHANGDGTHCPYSGQLVTAVSREQLMTGLDPGDERCPQGCPESRWTDPEIGTNAHTSAIVTTVKGWVA